MEQMTGTLLVMAPFSPPKTASSSSGLFLVITDAEILWHRRGIADIGIDRVFAHLLPAAALVLCP